jgi:Cystatin domain
MMVGGFGNEQDANQEIQDLINQVRPSVALQVPELGLYQAVKFSTQVVAGKNYLVKVLINPDQFIHIKVNVPLPYTNLPPSLLSLQSNKSRDDPL